MKNKIIKIGCTDYEIELSDNLYNETHTTGEICYNTAIIRLDNTVCDQIKKQTLCHEIAHGIMYEMSEKKLRGDENFINRLGSQLYILGLGDKLNDDE